MSAVSVILSLLGFIALTLGTAVFVAAEFSLTALERSTVDAKKAKPKPKGKTASKAAKPASKTGKPPANRARPAPNGPRR